MPQPARPARTIAKKEGEEDAPAKKGGKGADDSLSFADQILTKAPALGAHTNLHKLNLTNCGLTSIGFVKEAKSTLTWLKVEGNDLSAPDAWNGIEELSRLFVLNASNCKLTSVPSVVEVLLCLKALVISHNALTQLDHVRNLPDLNTIVVSNNALTSLPTNLTTLGSLKKISAAHNKLTPAGLPDLSLLSQLREIKFNDNPSLTSLPAHLSSWGKGSLSHLAEFRGKRAPGLEVVDLGNCGFAEWYDLAALAGQSGIVNLVLKGTAVAEEAKVDGFEDYKSKITILLPALRILDGQRFDAKFFDLKEKRLARPAAVVEEAEPPTASTSKAVATPITKPSTKSKRAAPTEEGESVVPPKKSKRKAAAVEEEEQTVESALKQASASAVEEGDGEVTEAKVVKKKKKNRHAPRHGEEAAVVVEAPPAAPMETPKDPTKKKSKRAKGKAVEKEAVELAEVVEPPRRKRDKRGVLGALRGDDKEEAAARRPPPGITTGANAIGPTPPTPGAEHTEKEKTSVLSVVVVKKDKGEAKKVVDLSSLLGGAATSLSGW